MNTFKITPEGIKQIRRNTLKILLPVVVVIALALPLIAVLSSESGEVNVLGLVILIPAIIGMMLLVTIRSTKRTAHTMESLVITIDEDSITRQQDNLSDLTISKSEIKEIIQGPKGDIVVKADSFQKFIILSRYTENLDEAKKLLESFAPIYQKNGRSALSYAIAFFAGILLLVAAFLFSEIPFVILFSGSLLLLTILCMIILTLLSKFLETKARIITPLIMLLFAFRIIQTMWPLIQSL